MARALFLGLPLHGHTNPSLPLVGELVARGEDVVYVSAPQFADAIGRTGARYRPYRNPFLLDLGALPQQTDELSWLLMRTTSEVLDQELDAFRTERPDYIISDSLAPWGRWVAEVLGIPVVRAVTTVAFNRRVLVFGVARGIRPKGARRALAKIRNVLKASLLRRQTARRHGVRGTGVTDFVFGQSALNIVFTSRYFQPCADTFDERYEFVGPSIAASSAVADAASHDASGRRLVYVSLGTLFNADAGFYRSCFDAFKDEHLRVLMSTGTRVSQASLGTPPDNVEVRPHVSQLEVLRRASVFVSHGGMNSVSESLWHGVPLVVVPQMGEQEIVGRQVEALGAGLCLAPNEVTPGRLRAAVNRVLDDTRFRERAAVVRASFVEAGGAARAADLIVAFARSHAKTRGRS